METSSIHVPVTTNQSTNLPALAARALSIRRVLWKRLPEKTSEIVEAGRYTTSATWAVLVQEMEEKNR